MRWIMAGPLTLIAATVTMAATPLWWPKGAAGIDNLVFAILLFPAFWGLYVFYSLIDAKVVRALIVIMAAIAINISLIYLNF
ncbi:hypothetical protein [Sphingomonas sp. 37zxx]|uniref:hypothetical protein n=1 Tax=Sphingomonas sp. 37zxx TaxID=1550073 RepID=UPI00053BE099|nr:hypothetical protein [Sphingomonas sp. 37zxx]